MISFPKSKRNHILSVRNGRLVVKVTAPAEDGKANAAIIRMLSKGLDPFGSGCRIELRSGTTSRTKTFYIENADVETMRADLNAWWEA
ncbi:MAG: DUF167 domain-containing protein [bacterium]|nr:DUF167 domain-containing protein [bacterium]